MDQSWLIYTSITVAYIVVLVIYFLRRTRHHESQLSTFLKTAKDQIDLHKKQASQTANVKVIKAAAVVKKVQQAAEVFEEKAQEEYELVIKDAKEERGEILAQAKVEIDQMFKQADVELEEYKKSRFQEIERNLVKLVMSVSERVLETSLTENQHKQIIEKALDEIKTSKSRS